MRYWLTPPELYSSLDHEFNFDFDPCPYPRTFDGLNCEWGKMNYVNPPFKKEDGGTGVFVHKAIAESKKGKSTFMVFSCRNAINLMLEAGAVPRSLGRIKWLDVDTKEPIKSPNCTVGFYLKGKTTLEEKSL